MKSLSINFLLVLVFFFLFSCGNKQPLSPTSEVKENPFLHYQVFYRGSELILQAEIIDISSDQFHWDSIKIFFNQEKNHQNKNYFKEYKKKVIYQKRQQNKIEISLFPSVEQRFFRLAYYPASEEKFFTRWKKPVKNQPISFPEASKINVDYTNPNRPLLTIFFENLANYSINFYGRYGIFPLFQETGNLQSYPIELEIDNLIIRYVDKYGNESRALDISNWFL